MVRGARALPLAVAPGTAPQLATLAARAFGAGGGYWTAERLLAGFGAGAGGGLAIADPDLARGLALVRRLGEEAELLDLGVVPEARRQGLGRALLDAALGRLAETGTRVLHLEVAEDNAPARALYAAAGFAETGRRPGYYAHGAAARLLARPLAPPAPACGPDGLGITGQKPDT